MMSWPRPSLARGFSILELLVVFAVVVALTLGLDLKSRTTWLIVIPVVVVILVAFKFLANLLMDKGVGLPFGQSKHRMSSRRRIYRERTTRTPQEEKLDAISDEALEAWIEKNPKDATAVEIHCERLLKAGRLADYARETEYFMTLKHGLTPEEACTRYQRLADLYANQLNRPDRAEELVRTIIADYPKSRHAVHARQWLARMQERRED